MELSNIQVTELGGSGDKTICRIAADRNRVIRKASIVLSGGTATSDGSNLWTFKLVDKSNSDAVLGSKATFAAGAAADVVADTETELTLTTWEVSDGHVLALFCDETGTAVDLSAVSITLKIEWV